MHSMLCVITWRRVLLGVANVHGWLLHDTIYIYTTSHKCDKLSVNISFPLLTIYCYYMRIYVLNGVYSYKHICQQLKKTPFLHRRKCMCLCGGWLSTMYVCIYAACRPRKLYSIYTTKCCLTFSHDALWNKFSIHYIYTIYICIYSSWCAI